MFNVLPFYTSTDQQNFRKEWCHDDVCQWKLLTTTWRLPPWQFQRPYSSEGVTMLELICYDATTGTDILPDITPSDLTIENADSVDWVTYFGNAPLATEMPCGTYYLKLTDGDGNVWYSEVFTVEDFTDDTETIYRKVYDFETPIRTTDDGTDSRIVN